MPYTINRTDGTTLVTLADGVVDTTTDLQLVGRNVAGYGEVQNENFVRLLENFASVTTPPAKPLVGQIWFDKNVDVLRPSVFDGVKWRQLGVLDVNATEPGTRKEGDLWWNSTDNKLYAWSSDGNAHVLIGPDSVTGFGITKWVSMKVTDTTGTDHAVSAGYIDGSIYAIIADANFTIDQTETPVAGFTDLHKGITLEGTTANDASTTTKYVGTATDSDKLKGRDGDTYANLADNEEITGIYHFKESTEGLYIGPDDQLRIITVNDDTKIWNVAGGTLSIGVDYTGAPSDKTVIGLSNKDVLPGVDEEFNFGSPSLKWRNIYANAIYANVVGDIVGDTVGTNTGNTFGTHTGPVAAATMAATNGSVISNNDLTTSDPLGTGTPATVQGRYLGTAAYVDDGVVRSTAQTITAGHTLTGNLTFEGNNTFQTSVNRFLSTARFEGTTEQYNGLISKGVIGKGAVPSLDASRNIGSLLVDEVTVKNSRIEGANTFMTGGTITQVDMTSSTLGVNGILNNVVSSQFTDRQGDSFTHISSDGTFGTANNNTVVTALAIKQYVDAKVASVGATIQFYLDTSNLSNTAVASQLERLAPANNYANGTEARILASYYYANHGVDQNGNPLFFYKYGVGTTIRRGIGYIGGRAVTVTKNFGKANDVLNARANTTGYRFIKRGVGNATNTVTSVTSAIPSSESDFFNGLTNGTINGWIRFSSALEQAAADYLGYPGAVGARILCFKDGVIIAVGYDYAELTLTGIKTSDSLGRNAFISGPFTINWTGKISGPAVPSSQDIECYSIELTQTNYPGVWSYVGSI